MHHTSKDNTFNVYCNVKWCKLRLSQYPTSNEMSSNWWRSGRALSSIYIQVCVALSSSAVTFSERSVAEHPFPPHHHPPEITTSYLTFVFILHGLPILIKLHNHYIIRPLCESYLDGVESINSTPPADNIEISILCLKM